MRHMHNMASLLVAEEVILPYLENEGVSRKSVGCFALNPTRSAMVVLEWF